MELRLIDRALDATRLRDPRVHERAPCFLQMVGCQGRVSGLSAWLSAVIEALRKTCEFLRQARR